MDREIILVALVILIPAALLWTILLLRTGKSRRSRVLLGIPAAMRPGQPDEVLEGRRLERVMVWGVLATVGSAVFIPAYWLPERQRQEAFQERFDEGSVERGEIVFQLAPQLPEDLPAAEYKEIEKEISLGMGCANCHGGDGSGGVAVFTDPVTDEKVAWNAPPLDNIFQRWDEELVRFTIERGRPGTPMPTWGVAYGGPMTSQMVTDVIAWLKTLPGNNEPPPDFSADCKKPPAGGSISCGQEIFEARCAVCHGSEGQGKEDPSLVAPDTTTEDPEDMLPKWYQGLALWGGDVLHLDPELHMKTLVEGRRFAFMPAFGEAPSQGIPPPLYPLTDEQIQSVILYERSLPGPEGP